MVTPFCNSIGIRIGLKALQKGLAEWRHMITEGSYGLLVVKVTSQLVEAWSVLYLQLHPVECRVTLNDSTGSGRLTDVCCQCVWQ